MPADGEITIRSIIREHNRTAMPRGLFLYVFQEKTDLYGTCFTNGLIAAGSLSLGRFMYYGRLTQAFHLSVPFTFAFTAIGSSYFVFKKRKEQQEEEKKNPDDLKYVKFKSKVPMTKEEMEQFQKNPNTQPKPRGTKDLPVMEEQ